MRCRILRIGVVTVIRRNQRNPQLARHLQQRCVHPPLVLISVILQFQIEIPLTKAVIVLQSSLLRCRDVSPDDVPRHLAGETRGACDQSLVVLPQQVHIHARLVIISLCEGMAHDLREVLIPLIILCQQDQMVIPVVTAGQFPVKPGPRRHIDLTAQNRIDALGLACLIEIDHAIHHTVIRDGRRVHPELLHPLHIFPDLVRPVEQRPLRVRVQMHKSHVQDSFLINILQI